MSSRLESVATAIDAVVERIGIVTAWTSFALVLVMAANVLLRYAFSIGSVWAQELEWHLLVPICLFGMSYALRHGEHVRVDVLYAGYSERNKIRVDLVTALVAIVICALIIRLSIPYVLQSWNNAEGSANPGGIPYRWALKALIPLGFLLFLLQSVSDAIRAWQRLSKVS